MPKKKAPSKMGRPTKFNQDTKQAAIDLAAKGKTDVQISEIIGICPKTLDLWKGRYPDFLRSLKEAKQSVDEVVEASLLRRAMGYYHTEERIFCGKGGKVTRVVTTKHYPPDPTSMIFWLKNRQSARWRDKLEVTNPPLASGDSKVKKTFEQFCLDAGYPAPFPKQLEMREFGLKETVPRLLLGARNYGKTDYVIIMGLAYEIYEEWFDGEIKTTNLIITKSDERNAAILAEISRACKIQGVTFEKENQSALRVTGLVGKDHTVSAVTVGSSSFRGRHPKRSLMDDPVTEDDVSEATRKKVQRVYNEVMKLSQNVLVIGQPVHKQDLYQRLRPLVKKMEVVHGTIPELDHDLQAQRLAGVTEESIQASYFLNVVSESASPLENVSFLDAYPTGGTSVAFLDPAFGAAKGGDYTALSCFKTHFSGVAVQGRVWKKAWEHCIDDIVKELVLRGVKRLCIETNNLGDMPVTLFRQAVPDGVGVVGRKSTNNKHSRIVAAGPFAPNIHLAKTSDRVYIEQVVMYEYGATHDDAPDSLATGLEWIGLIRGKQ